MKTPRNARLTRRRAAQVLDQATASGHPRLDELLSAATAPGAAAELRREDQAVSLFRGAALVSTPTPGKLTLIQSTRARLATRKAVVAGAAVAMLATGGVAYAAASDHLPNPLAHSSHATTGALHAGQAPRGKPTDLPTQAGPGTPSDTPSGNASPTPSFAGLCNAYQAGATSHGKAMSSAAFKALAAEAGGADSIAAYCTALIGAPGTHPTHPARPTQAPTTHPARPTQAPSQVPPPRPTQAPTTHPARPTAPPAALPTQANPRA